jgi:hypothetical protein
MNQLTTTEELAAEDPPKKRGRPRSGKALTESERQARRRKKMEEEGKTLLPRVKVTIEVAEALGKFIQYKDMTLGDALDRIVRDRLLRKRSGKRKTKRTTAEPAQIETGY